jgi:hypothetical protein
MNITTRLLKTIFIYLFIAILIIYLHPGYIFNEDGSLQPFGVGPEETLLYYPIILVLIAVILFYLSKSF